MLKPIIIAIDFDGTVVDHRFPDVGPDAPGALPVLRKIVEKGHKIILWTMRSGEHLDAAVKWYQDNDIPLYGIQRNPTQDEWTSSPKAYAQIYIDDAALGTPTVRLARCPRPTVDWETIEPLLWQRIEEIQTGQG